MKHASERPDPASPATVVVARHAAPGREAELNDWMGRLRCAVEQAPGHLASTFHPPGPAHPGEWLVIYTFTDGAHLDRWLNSPERQMLLAGSRELLFDTREQRIADTGVTAEATLVSSVRVRPEAEARYRELHDVAIRHAEQHGLVRVELKPAISRDQPETVTLMTFLSRMHLDGWLASPERQAIVDAMHGLAEGDRTLNVIPGFGGWFEAPTVAPARWKQACTVFAALVPVSLVVTATRTALLPDLPLLAATTITAAANVLILTWLVMPLVTRAAEPWLER